MRRHRRPGRSGHRGRRARGRTPGARTVRVLRHRLAPSGRRADAGARLPGARPGSEDTAASGAERLPPRLPQPTAAARRRRRLRSPPAPRSSARRRRLAPVPESSPRSTSISAPSRRKTREVVTILGQGVELEVTGATGRWLGAGYRAQLWADWFCQRSVRDARHLADPSPRVTGSGRPARSCRPRVVSMSPRVTIPARVDTISATSDIVPSTQDEIGSDAIGTACIAVLDRDGKG